MPPIKNDDFNIIGSEDETGGGADQYHGSGTEKETSLADLKTYLYKMKSKPYLSNLKSIQKMTSINVLSVSGKDLSMPCSEQEKNFPAMELSLHSNNDLSLLTLKPKLCLPVQARKEEYEIRLTGNTFWGGALRSAGWFSYYAGGRWFADEEVKNRFKVAPHVVVLEADVPAQDQVEVRNIADKLHLPVYHVNDLKTRKDLVKSIKHSLKSRLIEAELEKQYSEGYSKGQGSKAAAEAGAYDFGYQVGYQDGKANRIAQVVVVEKTDTGATSRAFEKGKEVGGQRKEIDRSRDYEQGFFDGKEAQKKLFEKEKQRLIDEAYQRGYSEGMAVQRSADEAFVRKH